MECHWTKVRRTMCEAVAIEARAAVKADSGGGAEIELATDIADIISVDQLPTGTRLVIQTASRDYLIETCGGLDAFLHGNPAYCAEPVPVYVRGSRPRGCALQPGSIRCGMPAEFWDPTRGLVITTSRVRRVLQVLAEARGYMQLLGSRDA
jgi:hypothetical protein